MHPAAIGPYQIERELGRGGMGEVYLARDTRLDRPVAIKALPAHLAQDPDRLVRVQREAKVLASLNHSDIGAIYGLEEANGHQDLVLAGVRRGLEGQVGGEGLEGLAGAGEVRGPFRGDQPPAFLDPGLEGVDPGRGELARVPVRAGLEIHGLIRGQGDAAAEAMRRILLDHAKGWARIKRDGAAGDRRAAAPIEDLASLACGDPEGIVRFDDALRRLEAESPDGAAVARLRFYAGLSVEQTAAALGLSSSTVDRRWAFVRAWLYRHLHETE